jgi:hypothetical protein
MKGRTWGSLRWLPIALSFVPALALAQHQHPQLHVNPRWEECSFQISSSLTQKAWRQFAGEAGVVTYFRPLAGALPMGRGKYEVSAMQWQSGIDDSDAAWNDTFVHPDSAHWLFEGEGLQFPGLAVRAGLTGQTDVGLYVTKNPRANYGFVGAQVQRALTGGAGVGKDWAVSGRASFVTLYGPEDIDFTVYGADLFASREFAVVKRVTISPYAGVSASLSRAHEKTSVVTLSDENVLGAHATLGVVGRVSVLRVAAEYSVARVNSMSLKIGFGN